MEKVLLSTLTKQVRGVSYSKDDDLSPVAGDGFAALLRTNNINKGKITNVDDLVYVSEQKIKKEQYLQSGDILIAASSGSIDVVGKSAIYEGGSKYTFGAFCKVVRPNKEKVNPKYVGYFFQTDFYRKKISTLAQGANINNLRNEHIDDLEIPLPDLETQNKIVAILDKAKNLLDRRERTIAMYDDLLRATFLEMFGDPFFNRKDFPTDSLENLCEFITKGTTPPNHKILKTEIKGSIPYLKVYHIVDGEIDFFHNPSFISNETHEELNRSKVFPNDILMNIVGPPLGKIGIVPNSFKEWNINQALAIFRPKERILPSYLLNVLQSRTLLSSIIRQAIGVRQLNLSLKQCREIIIPVPPIEMQLKFDSFYMSYKGLSNKLKTYLNEANRLVLSLSQQVFDDRLMIDIDTQLEALIDAIDLIRNKEKNKIDTITNDITFIQRLVDRVNEQEFSDGEQYNKAKYILFRIMKEEEHLVKQVFKNSNVELTLQNETS